MLKQASVIAIVLAVASPAAAQYAARRTGDTIQLEDVKNKTVVSVAPSRGNLTTGMNVNGHEVLRANGIPFLAPWANRLDEQAFYANGKKYLLTNHHVFLRSAGFYNSSTRNDIVNSSSSSLRLESSGWALSPTCRASRRVIG